METLTQEQMAERFDYLGPLKPGGAEKPSEMVDNWPISFDYLGGESQCHISLWKAKFISADLARKIAEEEYKQLMREFRREREYGKQLAKSREEESKKAFDLQMRVNVLEHQVRQLKKKARGK